MKDLKAEEKKQLKKIRDNVYYEMSGKYIFDKDKFTQQIIKETYKETKKELIHDLLRLWILENIKCSDSDNFFSSFERKFRADLQKVNYSLEELDAITKDGGKE